MLTASAKETSIRELAKRRRDFLCAIRNQMVLPDAIKKPI
jgi:hypothetical protein